jgi:integrase/recombinase XerC
MSGSVSNIRLNSLSLISAVPLDAEAEPEIAEFAIPAGFPIPYRSDIREIEEALLWFLLDRYLTPGNRFRKNSTKAAASDLVDWWTYLDHADVRWNEATIDDVSAYAESMADAISPYTGEGYAQSTIRRRKATLRKFYSWAEREELVTATLFAQELADRSHAYAPIDRSPRAHLGGATQSWTTTIQEKVRGRPGEEPSPFDPLTWRSIAAALGPTRPDEIDERSPRFRLASEIALQSGMRIDEVCSLYAAQFLVLTWPDDASEDLQLFLPITETKGLTPRTIELPLWLVKDILTYIEGERAQMIEEGMTRKNLRFDHGRLFVNGLTAKAHVGKPLQASNLSKQFNRAVKIAGLTRTVIRQDPDTLQPYEFTEASHSFHDLRHSFAIWRYYLFREMGDPSPWHKLAIRLGHQNHVTTRRFYLKHTLELEATVSNAVQAFFRYGVIRSSEIAEETRAPQADAHDCTE